MTDRTPRKEGQNSRRMKDVIIWEVLQALRGGWQFLIRLTFKEMKVLWNPVTCHFNLVWVNPTEIAEITPIKSFQEQLWREFDRYSVVYGKRQNEVLMGSSEVSWVEFAFVAYANSWFREIWIHPSTYSFILLHSILQTASWPNKQLIIWSYYWDQEFWKEDISAGSLAESPCLHLGNFKDGSCWEVTGRSKSQPQAECIYWCMHLSTVSSPAFNFTTLLFMANTC